MRWSPVVLAALLCAAPAEASWETCSALDDVPSDARIAACAAVIESAAGDKDRIATAYYNRGSAWRDRGELDKAIADYSEAISREPDHPDAYTNRGIAYRIKGDLAKAIADYGEVLRLNPGDSASYVDRGSARFEIGRFAEAASDFGAALSHGASDGYTVLWRHLARARAGQADASELLWNAGKIDRARWPGPLIALFLGETGQDEVHAAADKGDANDQETQRCELSFYLGEYELLRGDKPRARSMFQTAAEICPKSFYERGAARAELKRLGR
jgi:lipoprotein NlpI